MEVAIAQRATAASRSTSEGIDDIVGIVYAKDLMRAERDGNGDEPVARAAAAGALRARDQAGGRAAARDAGRASSTWRSSSTSTAAPPGLVTLEDLIEELVGEIVDEFDVEEPLVEPLPDGDVRVNARMPIDELNELLDADLPEGDWDTVGGLVLNLLGHVPAEGETRRRATATGCAPSRCRAGASAGCASRRLRHRRARADEPT